MANPESRLYGEVSSLIAYYISRIRNLEHENCPADVDGHGDDLSCTKDKLEKAKHIRNLVEELMG